MKLAFRRSKFSKEEAEKQALEELEAAMARAKPPSDAERTWVHGEASGAWQSRARSREDTAGPANGADAHAEAEPVLDAPGSREAELRDELWAETEDGAHEAEADPSGFDVPWDDPEPADLPVEPEVDDEADLDEPESSPRPTRAPAPARRRPPAARAETETAAPASARRARPPARAARPSAKGSGTAAKPSARARAGAAERPAPARTTSAKTATTAREPAGTRKNAQRGTTAGKPSATRARNA